MMIVRISTATLVVALSLLYSSSGQADSAWNGPGWYLMNDYALGAWTIETGPYASQDQCLAARSTQNDKYNDLRCAYLNNEADENKQN